MASNVVSIAVQANSTQLQTAFDQGASSADRFKAKMGLVAKAVVAALAFKAAQAITDFVGDSIEAFSDLNESLNAVEVTFGDAADGIKELGEGAARNLGLSNAEFNTFAVQISAFAKQIAGDGGDVVGVVDELSTRVTDFASVMNLDVADAATKFQSGLAGESEPLRKFGIDVSAAKVEAFAFANGIATAGSELTEAQKVTARYGTIMEQTEQVQGDFANTADDYANAQRIANAEMENAKARTGELLVPFAQLTTQVKALAAEAVSQLALGLMQLTGQISETDEAIGRFELSTGASADSAASALTIVKEYGGSFEELLPRLNLSREELEKLTEADEDFLRSMGFTEEQIKSVSEVAKTELSSALTNAEAAARASFAANEDLAGSFTELDQTMEESAEATRKSAEKSREEFRDLADAAEEEFAKAAQDVDDFITGFEELPERQEITLDEWITNMQERTAAIEQWYRDLNILAANGMAEFAEEMRQGGFDATHGLVDEAVDAIGTEKGRLLESTASAANDVGRELALGMAGGIQQYAGEIGRAAVAAVNAAVARAKSAAHIESPSKLMAEEIGKPLAEGIAMGIEQSDATNKAIESTVTGLPRVNGSHVNGSSGAAGGSSKSSVMFNGDFVFRTEASADDISRALAWKLRTLGI